MKELFIDIRRVWGCALPPLQVKRAAVRRDAEACREAHKAPPFSAKARGVSPAEPSLDEMIAALSRLGGLNVAERERFSRGGRSAL